MSVGHSKGKYIEGFKKYMYGKKNSLKFKINTFQSFDQGTL